MFRAALLLTLVFPPLQTLAPTAQAPEKPGFFYSSWPTPAMLEEALVYYGVPQPCWWVRVARLESGLDSSRGCGRYNNLWGMNMPRRRRTVALRRHDSGYAVFGSWQDAVLDLRLYVQDVDTTGIQDFPQWLAARRWNTEMPGYYQTLTRVSCK